LEIEEDVEEEEEEEEVAPPIPLVVRIEEKPLPQLSESPPKPTPVASVIRQEAQKPAPPSPKVSASGDLPWTTWLLVKNNKSTFFDSIPSSPAVYEIGISLRDMSTDAPLPTVPTRDRIRVTNVKFIGAAIDLQDTISNHCMNEQDPLHSLLKKSLDDCYDIFVHLCPMRTRASAVRMQNEILNNFCYEWNNQERSKGKSVRGKVYHPQPVELDEEVLKRMENLRLRR